MPARTALAHRIKAYRKEQHLSQIECAVDMGISTEELSLIERGLANPTLSVLEAIASYMGIELSDLFRAEERDYEEHKPGYDTQLAVQSGRHAKL